MELKVVRMNENGDSEFEDEHAFEEDVNENMNEDEDEIGDGEYEDEHEIMNEDESGDDEYE